MAVKKPFKAKRPAAKKADGKKPAPVKAALPKHKPVAAKPAPAKAKPPVPATHAPKPSAAKVAAKPAVAKPAIVKPVAAKPGVAKPAVVKPVSAPLAAKQGFAAKPAIAAKPALVAKPATPARPGPDASSSRPRPAGPPFPAMPRPYVTTRPPLPPGDGDDDAADGLSLLAGPRNVTPYLAKKGEQYMGKAQLDHFRTILLSWKRDLMEEVDRTVTHMKDEAANPPDPNDRATLESEFSLELRTRDRERKLIRKIDEALKRIEDGSYGYCLETGEEIGIKRLEARPVATLSIEAQERRERREKQYGDRDDRYR
jgi:DnaK suppressor protein